MAEMLGLVALLCVAGACMALVCAPIVQALTKVLATFEPSFFAAYKATFLATVVEYLLPAGLSLALLFFNEAGTLPIWLFGLLFVSGFFLAAYVLGTQVRDPEKGALGFGKACAAWLLVNLGVGVVYGAFAAAAIEGWLG